MFARAHDVQYALVSAATLAMYIAQDTLPICVVIKLEWAGIKFKWEALHAGWLAHS